MSQFGADHWVLSLNATPGFYVDVGCHDGIEISNTKILDINGWKGICIDPFPKNFETRTAQVVKACVYSSNDTEIEFDYSIEDPGCSGVNSELGIHKDRLYKTTTIQKHKFKTRTLESILEECKAPPRIEYLNLDIEGSEFEVLKVFPFAKYTFKCMTIEHNYEEPKRSLIRQLLESNGYKVAHSVHVDDWYVNPSWTKNPRVVISLTSIPSRFDKLPMVLQSLVNQTCHEVWLNIPPKYNRFPDWDGQLPDLSVFGSKLKINRDCEDLGPGTKFMGPVSLLDPDDLIVYVDDDTCYDPKLLTNLLKWHRTDTKSAWGLSGFNFETYFEGKFPRQHGVPVDVLEGYGSVIVKVAWLQKILPEFKELLNVTWHDDMILCNLFEKHGIKRKTVFVPECNIGQLNQYNYGFEADALHHIAGDGGHVSNNLKILKGFEDKGKMYFSYKC